MQALLTEDSAAFVADYPSGTFRGLPAYEKHQRAAMKWASRLLQHQLVEPDGPMEVDGDAATAPWEFEYTVRHSAARAALSPPPNVSSARQLHVFKPAYPSSEGELPLQRTTCAQRHGQAQCGR